MKKLIVLLFILLGLNGLYSCKAQNIQNTKDMITSFLNFIQHGDGNGKLASSFSRDIVPILDSIYGIDQILKNGKIYDSNFGITGSPFLYDNALDGQITVRSVNFELVKLLFDIYKDQIVCLVENKSGHNNLIIMNSLAVDSFNFKDQYFINYPYEKLGLKGYYELIYEGNEFSLLVKWNKSKIRANSINQSDYFSESGKQLFLVNNKGSFRVKNKKDFINFLGIDKATLKKKYKHKFPNISKASNEELSTLSEYFDSNK